MSTSRSLLSTIFALSLLTATPVLADADKPAALVADGVPAVPDDLVSATRPYMEYRTAAFQGWDARDKSMLITTRFGNTPQLHRVKGPMMARTQISFEEEPVSASPSPTGDIIVVQKDTGGSEFFQLYTLANGKLGLLTDGKSRNEINVWSRDGHWLAYSSTRRNGADTDLYIIDPRDPKSDHMVAQVKGGGWAIAAISPDNSHAIAVNYISVTNTDLYDLDLKTGAMTPVGDASKDIAYGGAEFAPDGTLWVTSDDGSDFQRLGTLNIKTGKFTVVSPEKMWDVEGFDIAHDGSFIAYKTNEAGISKLKLLDIKTKAVRIVSGMPAGTIGNFEVAPWGTIGLTVTSAKAASDAYTVNPKTLAATRWTQSETGGLDPLVNVDPQFIQVKSFDGETVSGFLYRPDPKKFPGKRPLIVNIHGGPEGEFTPGFMGRTNYLLNELGIAVFAPNVRGSTGFGKRFVSLDNGPFKREDSVKDIGAFLDVLDTDPALDASYFAVQGGSYGGYMCYAVAIRYGDRLKAANCIVAISNFVTFLENTQAYRRDLRRVEYGDERDPAQRARLIEISPLTNVDKLHIPIYVVSGANDPRVPPSEADQIVKAVRAKGGTAWSLLAQDEGHGFQKKANVDYQFWTTLLFWQQTLLSK